MYTKEFPDGGILAVKRCCSTDGDMIEEFVEILKESPMARAQGTGIIYSRFSCG